MKTEKFVIGFDIGGTKIAVALGSSDGKILKSKRLQSAGRLPDEVLDECISTAEELLSNCGLSKKDLAAAGIGIPGPMDMAKGTISPCNMHGWIDVPIRDYISNRLGVKTYFDNDANAGVLAEWFFGAGKKCRNLIYLTMSTGIGGGIIANGRLIQGATFLAGEMGHIVLDPDGPACSCGLKGCYEAFCGGKAVALRMRNDLQGQPDHPLMKIANGKIENLGYPALIEGVKAQNGYALKIWDDICMRNAQAIGIFANIFNPEMIVLGTIAFHAKSLLLEPIKKQLPKFSWKQMLEAMTLTTSALEKNIGEYSGICVALNGFLEEGKWSLPWENT